MKWYVLHVRTGREDEIKKELIRKGYTAAAPIEIITERRDGKWREKLKQVFPGYAFIKLDLTDDDYYSVTAVPGVIRFLGVNCPEPLRENEEDFIIWLDNEGVPLATSDILFKEGQPATIISGPLKGREGIIVSINKRQRRAFVEIAFGGSRKKFSLSVNVLSETEDFNGV